MLSFANATGNLFNRLGKCALLVKQCKTYQTAQNTNLFDPTNGIVGQFNSEADIQAIAGSAWPALLTGPENACSLARNVAAATVNRMVFRDNPLPGQNLTQSNVAGSLNEIFRQMRIAGASVLAMTVTGTPGAWTGTGNGFVNVSVKRPSDGRFLENLFAENLLVKCTNDSYTGGASAGSEGFLITGVGAEGDLFAFDWPLGSNGRAAVTAINGNLNNTGGNILTNSGFATWTTTANVPNNWSLTVGVAGTNTLQESTIVYDSGSSLAMVGDGTTLTTLSQQFNASSGTSGQLSPLKQYGFNIVARRDGVAPGAGTLVVELVDSGGTQLLDANGVANAFSIDLTALTVNFQSFTGVFRTPMIMPSSAYIRLRQSVALSNGRTVYLDMGSLGSMTQIYTGGPFVSIHAGSNPFVNGDYSSIAMTNSRGAAGTLSTWQTAFYQLFPDVVSGELLVPSSNAPTIADALIG